MGYVVKVPKLGLEMDSGTVTAWFADEGDEVDGGEVIAEIESEKTSAEVEAREGGVLRRRYMEAGDSGPPGAPMGIVAGPDEDLSELEATVDEGAVADDDAGADDAAAEPAAGGEEGTEPTAAGDVKASPRARKRADELDVDLATVTGSGPGGAITEADVEAAGDDGAEAVKASPRARKRAEELGVDLAAVSGTGPQGSVTAEDVEAAAESTTTPATGDGVEERPLDGMRRTIASRLGKSYREAVHVTEHREADAEALRAAAKAAAAVHEESVTVTDVLLTAVSATLDDHRAFNATFEDDVHRLHEEHNLCVAVDVDDGLIAPVIRGADRLGVADLARKRAAVTERALSGEYTMDDLSGGTFTVSNLGLLGVEAFDPVINPPQVAILGVDALAERPVASDGEVVVRRTLPLDLSFDHRIVDGADAARFLETLVGHIEEPWPLLEGVSPADVPSDVDWRGAAGAIELPERDVTASVAPDLSGTVAAGSEEWPFDVTADLGGGRAPTPVDYFLGALSACLADSIGIQADMRDVAFDGIDVRVVGSPRDGNESVEGIEIDVEIDADPDVDDATLERIVAGGERSCHVAELLREDLDVDLAWHRR
ncbi:2-oxo acid dehydrogenase subunit E2 [Salinilacihabitans rarus]|uniref:2-oxo acid dehydrogenase subunit E2 n=1 Tax=Salinilacihabitans rarus TaxID=2961596 RepID=UPI0020C87EFE|nr:2-oxo acid dehydrogenase subunit E2 [Salinilacihabitans rarus]